MKEIRRKQGTTYINDHPLYNIWSMIKQRCNNPKHTHYNLYGGRGVKICERWTISFAHFIEDVGERPSLKHTLDRFPNKKGNYEPGNVRWATVKQQNENKRKYRTMFRDIPEW